MTLDRNLKHVLILIVICVLFTPCRLGAVNDIKTLLEGVPIKDDLNEHSLEFNKPEIIKVTEALYVAVGYGIANTIFVVAPKGLIVIDTLESATAAKKVFEDFRKIVPKSPVKAIIYTHNHGDHTEGTRVFMEDLEDIPEIWAHYKLSDAIKPHSIAGPVLFNRAIRQFGHFLPNEKPWFLNSGIGPKMVLDPAMAKKGKTGLVWPTHFLEEDQKDVVLAGLEVTLMHIPGETPDHLGVYIPSMSAYMCGDNLYKTFPNLYAIRGTTLRDPLVWIQSLDKIRKIEPQYLLPSHTKPIAGRDNVMNVLTMYRDGIQLVHDQTVRLMNKGYHRNEIGRMLAIPPQQLANRYLREHYGTIEWSAKAIFNKYMGWFSGTPEELSEHTPLEQAKRTIKLAGGKKQVLFAAQKALLEKDYQWALELATCIGKVDKSNEDALQIRKEALKALAGKHSSPNARNYYLTTILEDYNAIQIKSPRSRNFALHLPMDALIRSLSYGVNVQQCGAKDICLLLNFTDINHKHILHLRNSIVESYKWTDDEKLIFGEKINCKVNLNSVLFREVIGQLKPQEALLTSRQDECEHDLMKTFLGCFEFAKPDYDFGFGSQ